jgi:integrase
MNVRNPKINYLNRLSASPHYCVNVAVIFLPFQYRRHTAVLISCACLGANTTPKVKRKYRDKGESSVFFRQSDQRWVSVIYPASGERKVFYGKTEPEVKKKLKTYKEELIKHGFVGIQKRTVRDYMDEWLYTIKKNELKPKSFDSIENTLKNQIYPVIGDLQLGQVKSNDIQLMLITIRDKEYERTKGKNSTEVKKEKYSNSTIKKAYDVVNACFKRAVDIEELNKNPCRGVSIPKSEKKSNGKRVRFLEQDSIDKLCAESIRVYGNGKSVYRLGYAIIFLLYTGLRIGELTALRWNDIDFENKTVKIKHNAILVKNRGDDKEEKKYSLEMQDSVKTESSERIIPLNKKAMNALNEIQKINGKFQYVMSTENGSICYPRNIDRMLKGMIHYLNKNNIWTETPFGVHVLRHSYASMLFRKGVDVKTVSELLGHSSVTFTYNIYIHLIQEQKQQAVSLLDDI